jgi:hypothetical protein
MHMSDVQRLLLFIRGLENIDSLKELFSILGQNTKIHAEKWFYICRASFTVVYTWAYHLTNHRLIDYSINGNLEAR